MFSEDTTKMFRILFCIFLVLMAFVLFVRSTYAADSIVLTWGLSTDNVAVAGYRVWYASTPTGLFTLKVADVAHPGNVATFLDLADGQHCYTVSAVDTSGNESPKAPPVCATLDRTAPSVPVNLKLTWGSPPVQ